MTTEYSTGSGERREFPSGEPGALRLAVTNRREFLIGARTVGILSVFAPATLRPRAIAEDAGAERAINVPTIPSSATPTTDQPSAEETIRRLLRGAKPINGKVHLEVPEIAENGNVVPFTISLDSPMTETDFVKSVHVVCTGNLQAHIGSFHFTQLSGRATVTSRMRLAKSQNLFVLVEYGDGQFVMAQRTIKVTIGGCGGT